MIWTCLSLHPICKWYHGDLHSSHLSMFPDFLLLFCGKQISVFRRKQIWTQTDKHTKQNLNISAYAYGTSEHQLSKQFPSATSQLQCAKPIIYMGEKKKLLEKPKLPMKSFKIITLNSSGESHLSKSEKCAFRKLTFCTRTIEKHFLTFPNAFGEMM